MTLPDALVDPNGEAWARLCRDAIQRHGGPLAFALACEVDLDRSTIKCRSSGGVSLTIGRVRLDDGSVARGEFKTGTCALHGYGVVTSPNGRVREGEWVDGRLHGMGLVLDDQGFTSVGIYINDLPVGRFFGARHDEAVALDRWLPPQEAADSTTYGFASEWSACGQTTKTEARADGSRDDSQVCRHWANGDCALERWVGGTLIGLTFTIAPAAGGPVRLAHGATLSPIKWRIHKHAPTAGCLYGGYTYVPADTESSEFVLFSAYILSGHSARDGGFCEARQRAFVDAICGATPNALP